MHDRGRRRKKEFVFVLLPSSRVSGAPRVLRAFLHLPKNVKKQRLCCRLPFAGRLHSWEALVVIIERQVL